MRRAGMIAVGVPIAGVAAVPGREARLPGMARWFARPRDRRHSGCHPAHEPTRAGARPPARRVVLLAAALLAQPGSLHGAPPAMPRAEVAQSVHDFGSVTRGQKVSRAFTIKNAGAGELVLGSVEIAGAGIATVRMRGRIAPGKAGDVIVTVDTRGLSGDVAAGVAFGTNDPELPRIALMLKGRVKPVVEVLPSSAVSRASVRNKPGKGSVAAVNNDNVPLRKAGAAREGDLIRVALDNAGGGAEDRVRVASSALALAGRREGRSTLATPNAPVPQPSVVVNLQARNRVYASPEEIDFGTIKLEDLARKPALAPLLTQRVVVRGRAGNDFRIEIDGPAPFLKVLATPPGGSATHHLDVSLVPEGLAPGKLDATLRVRTNDAEFPVIAIPIRGEII